MSDAPTLGKRRSSARIAATETAAAAVPSLLKRKSSTGLVGAMSGLETGPPAKGRKKSVVGDKSAFAMFQKAANAPPPKTGKEALKKAKFDDKMAKFESGAAFEKPATKNDACISGVAARLKALDKQAKEAEAAVPVRKKTWAVDMSGGGHNTAKTKIGNGPAPKRGFADLP